MGWVCLRASKRSLREKRKSITNLTKPIKQIFYYFLNMVDRIFILRTMLLIQQRFLIYQNTNTTEKELFCFVNVKGTPMNIKTRNGLM